MVTGDIDVPVAMLRRGFFPFCRISRQLFTTIDKYYQAGWSGHYEALWATIAEVAGHRIEAILGGDPDFIPMERMNKYAYSTPNNGDFFLSTFGAWPYYSEKSNFVGQSPKNILWHPVKI